MFDLNRALPGAKGLKRWLLPFIILMTVCQSVMTVVSLWLSFLSWNNGDNNSTYLKGVMWELRECPQRCKMLAGVLWCKVEVIEEKMRCGWREVLYRILRSLGMRSDGFCSWLWHYLAARTLAKNLNLSTGFFNFKIKGLAMNKILQFFIICPVSVWLLLHFFFLLFFLNKL